jgi:hypothetical protein
MLTRCHNINCRAYPRYGGRGFDVEWPDYGSFRDWALANGYQDDLSIDRIDGTKGYSAKNCRWATAKEQRHNTAQYRRDHLSNSNTR